MAAGDGRSYTSFTARLAFMVSRFGGQYIAMVDGRVVAHGRDAKQVYDRARRVHPKGRIFLGHRSNQAADGPIPEKRFWHANTEVHPVTKDQPRYSSLQ